MVLTSILLDAHKEAYDKAIEEGYLKFIVGRTDLLEKAFYQWCKENRKPLVKVAATKRYGKVSLDMLTTQYNLTQKAQDKIEELFYSHCKNTGHLSCSREWCDFQKVPVKKSDDLAKKLLAIADSEKEPI